jgi:hypothetical protein
MSDFYLTLPSNSSMQYYPDNTLARYTTMLPNCIDLKGDWEVGLVEIQYPHNWYNIPGPKRYRTFQLTTPAVDNPDGPVGEYSFFISEGYYPNIQHLLKEIEKEASIAMNVTGQSIQFEYQPVTRKVIVPHEPNWTLQVPAHIRTMLGMTHARFDRDHTKAPEVVDMDPVDTMYVYCDVVEPRVVGDSLVPLLRIVPAGGYHGQLVTLIYDHIHYVRVAKKNFQTVEIDIRDRIGRKVPFEQGSLNITLHFRQRKRLSTL